MQVQLNTDKSIEGHARLNKYLNEVINDELAHYDELVTRIEVFLSDENGDKSGPDDKKCVLEARLKNKKPIAVTTHADSLEKVMHIAITKLKGSLAREKSKLQDH